PNGGILDPRQSVVVSGNFSGYKFDVVAAETRGFAHLGTGPSINNDGHVGFQGTPKGNGQPGNVDSIYIWSKEKGAAKSLVSGGMIKKLLPNNGSGVPSARFSGQVSLNDKDQLLAERQMSALAAIGVLPMGLPLLTFSDVILTYAESWDGAS